MKTIINLALVCAFGLCKAQSPIDVAENTFKVKGLGEEVFYYGFAAGDQIIFSFSEVDNKELKEVEIIEMPGSSKCMDFKSKKIDTKTLHVSSEAIYKFRFANGNVAGRICRVKIQRIPASPATANFNTNVLWRTVYDTTYHTEQETYLVKSDTIVRTVMDRNEKVDYALLNPGSNVSYVRFVLPENTVSWSYYIGVEGDGITTEALAKDAADQVAKIKGGAMGALALYGMSYFAKMSGRDAIYFDIVDDDNYNLVSTGNEYRAIKDGVVVNDFAQMRTPAKREYYFHMRNDKMHALNILLKVSAVIVNNQWGTRPVSKMNINQRQQAYLAK
jgi:hypothetical protein